MFPVLLPTETINRELDSHLLLGAHLVQRGAHVFIGHQDAIHTAARYLRGGVLVGKSFEPTFPNVDLSWYEHVRARDVLCVHLDDEGAIFPGTEADWRTTLARRLDVNRIATDDIVCVWGRFQKSVYEAQKGPQLVRVTGHPRFDLYSKRWRSYFEPAAARLRARHGDFLLLNTNLSTANHGLGIRYPFSPRARYDPAKPESRHRALHFWAHTSRILVSFVELIHRLSDAFPRLNIIVRPHPSENHDYYRIVTAGLRNVTVLHEGSVAPWIFASKAVIHDGCTTGVEAWLGGVPVINYKALTDERYDQLLPNHFGARCTTQDEVVATIERILAGDPPAPGEVPALHRELMANFEGDSLPLILEVIELALKRVGPPGYRPSPHRIHAKVEAGLELARGLYRSATPARRQMSKYSRQKFYGFGRDDVADRIRRLAATTSIRFRSELLSDQLLCLWPA